MFEGQNKKTLARACGWPGWEQDSCWRPDSTAGVDALRTGFESCSQSAPSRLTKPGDWAAEMNNELLADRELYGR